MKIKLTTAFNQWVVVAGNVNEKCGESNCGDLHMDCQKAFEDCGAIIYEVDGTSRFFRFLKFEDGWSIFVEIEVVLTLSKSDFKEVS